MSDPSSPMRRLISTLVHASTRRILPWQAISEYSFALTSPEGSLIVISSRDSDNIHPYVLDLFSAGSRLLESVASGWHNSEDLDEPVQYEWNDDLEAIYLKARSASMGVDQAVEEFVRFLAPEVDEPF